MTRFGTDPSVDCAAMTDPDATPARNRRGKRELGLVESAGAGHDRADETCAPAMAVSIAGVSTACSRDALASSAEAVRRTLDPG